MVDVKKLKPGSELVITGNSNSHEFEIGEIVRGEGYDSDHIMVDPCDGEIRCKHLDGSDWWWVAPQDARLYNGFTIEKLNKGEKFKLPNDDRVYKAGSFDTKRYRNCRIDNPCKSSGYVKFPSDWECEKLYPESITAKGTARNVTVHNSCPTKTEMLVEIPGAIWGIGERTPEPIEVEITFNPKK